MENQTLSVPPDYAATNAALWDARTAHHVGSKSYDVQAFLERAQTLKSIELDLLGSVSGKSVLHLQYPGRTRCRWCGWVRWRRAWIFPARR